jgi:lysine 2,3-aminomutase
MADETKGANHFRSSIETGLKIAESLRGFTSGLAIPHFVIDAPGGGGKIPIMPNYVLHRDEKQIILRNFRNEVYSYKNYADKNNPDGYGSKRKKTNSKKKSGRKKIAAPVLEEI